MYFIVNYKSQPHFSTLDAAVEYCRFVNIDPRKSIRLG